ncbi:hypothetical protein CDD81_4628 [Ophiocordyceps australis]|uniref:Uncharacterized protein n=1 Tax=Ophiocordyceps australis TaxID=1399860 RepID=A0A2C5Y6S5_9HYPO|nr:hypothetical protein CDD81_4628 [Ophiocordyceps australis]
MGTETRHMDRGQSLSPSQGSQVQAASGTKRKKLTVAEMLQMSFPQSEGGDHVSAQSDAHADGAMSMSQGLEPDMAHANLDTLNPMQQPVRQLIQGQPLSQYSGTVRQRPVAAARDGVRQLSPSQAQQNPRAANEAASDNAPQDSASPQSPRIQGTDNDYVLLRGGPLEGATLPKSSPSQSGASRSRSPPSGRRQISAYPARPRLDEQGGSRAVTEGSEPLQSQHTDPSPKPGGRSSTIFSSVRKKLTPEPRYREYWVEESESLFDKNNKKVPSTYDDTIDMKMKPEWYKKTNTWIKWQLNGRNDLTNEVHRPRDTLSAEPISRQEADYEKGGKLYDDTGRLLPTSLSEAKRMGYSPLTFYTRERVFVRLEDTMEQTHVRLPHFGEPGFAQNKLKFRTTEMENSIDSLPGQDAET